MEERIKNFKKNYFVLNETEKAFKIAVVVVIKRNGDVHGFYESYAWVPKSQINEEGELPGWLLERIYDDKIYSYDGQRGIGSDSTLFVNGDGSYAIENRQFKYSYHFRYQRF